MSHFFATPEDLLPVFASVETRNRLAYTLMDHIDSPRVVSFLSASEIPTLFQPSPADSSINCPAYLVTRADQPISVRELPSSAGTRRWAIDQLDNPESTVLWHGGMYGEGVLLSGRVATASTSPTARSLQRAFDSAIKKQFTRIRSYYVGKHAELLLDGGCRLTMSAQSPALYDLSR